MDWLGILFTQDSVAGNILALAVVVALGVWLGRFKIKGVGIGITWILFAGIVLGHFGFSMTPKTLGFVKEFGLILFVCSIGLQVGPSFFSLFKATGLRLNLLALYVVLCAVFLTAAVAFFSGMPIETLAGIMSGAVTNTPALGAASQAYFDVKGTDSQSIALGYAAAYPMGVMGVIGSMIVFRKIFEKMSLPLEQAKLRNLGKETSRVSVELRNEAVFGKTIESVHELVGRDFVISRICKNGETMSANAEMVLERGDKILIIAKASDLDFFTTFFGVKIDFQWRKIDTQIDSAKFLVSIPKLEGRTLFQLGLYGAAAFNITRVNRAGTDLIPHSDLKLQLGDKLTVVGSKEAIGRVEAIVGNSVQKIQFPNLFPLFLAVVLGVILGCFPVSIPGMPQAVKLGLAGGPLIVAILIGYFGPRLKISTYSSTGATLMARELGIALFLAAVGIGAGEQFFKTVFSSTGALWVAIGALITLVPTITAYFVGRILLKLDYFTIIGVLSGSTTNPPALAYANSQTDSDTPAVSYATVYPLSMFLRVITAQVLILLFL